MGDSPPQGPVSTPPQDMCCSPLLLDDTKKAVQWRMRLVRDGLRSYSGKAFLYTYARCAGLHVLH